MPFQATSRFPARRKRRPEHHISENFHLQIRFALLGFQSLLLAQSRLISSPAGTKTFQFPAFPTLSGSRRKSYSEISGSTVAYTSPEHFAVSRVLRRRLKPSLPPVRVVLQQTNCLLLTELESSVMDQISLNFARPHKHVVFVWNNVAFYRNSYSLYPSTASS